jgi:hypothetical protein
MEEKALCIGSHVVRVLFHDLYSVTLRSAALAGHAQKQEDKQINSSTHLCKDTQIHRKSITFAVRFFENRRDDLSLIMRGKSGQGRAPRCGKRRRE